MFYAAGYPGKILGASIFLLTALASLPGCSHYDGVENLTGPKPKTTEYEVVDDAHRLCGIIVQGSLLAGLAAKGRNGYVV